MSDTPEHDVLAVSCDGSSLGNPGPGGWCWYVDDQRWAAGGDPDTTNNKMELHAVANALVATRNYPGPVEMRCDSKYVIDAVTKWVHGWRKRGWKTAKGSPVANREAIEGIVAELEGRDVTFTWVRGHDGDPGNEAADVRARGAATAVRDGLAVDVGPYG